VPEEVSVMGFDGTEMCDLVSPRITAVALPFEQIGIKAIEILNRQISGEQSLPQAIMLPLGLRAGESVAAVAEIQ
jgi:LacI family transcriptional regulator